MDGFSFSCVGKEIEGILSSLDEKSVVLELKKMGKKLCGDKGKFSIVLLTDEGLKKLEEELEYLKTEKRKDAFALARRGDEDESINQGREN